MKTDWKWLDTEVVIAIHDQQIAEHGEADGFLDMGLIEIALAGSRNLAKKYMLGCPLYIILQCPIHLWIN